MAHTIIRRITSRSIDATDVTTKFGTAAEQLETGQLIKDEAFTLFESVSALEIGDPKMDSGHLEPNEPLFDEYDTTRDLLPEEVLGVIDQMLCHEVAWYMGYPLSQTLFTSTHIDRLLWPEPKSLEEAQFWRGPMVQSGGPLLHHVLRAYCLGTIKCCDLVRKQIFSQLFYEEEDFSTHLYNRQLLHDVDIDEVQILLDNAQAWLEESQIGSDVATALNQRLILRQEMLSAYQNDATALVRRDSSAYSTCLALVQPMKETHSLAVSLEGSFTLKIQRTLASSVPPRPMVKVPFAETLEFLARLFQDAIDLTFLNDVRGNETLFHTICLFMSRRPQPAIYIRSLLQSLLHQNGHVLGHDSLQQFILLDLESLVLPGSELVTQRGPTSEASSNERSPIAMTMNDFIERVSQQYLNIFRLVCLNRARARRTLCHFAADWDNLQVDVEQIDTTLQSLTHEVALEYDGSLDPAYSYPLSSWMYHYKLILLRHIIQMGFELNMYAIEEIPGMLWYLSHVCTTHLAHLNRMSFFVEENGKMAVARSKLKQSSASSLEDRHDEVEHALWKLDRTFQEIRANDNLAEALHALFIVLQRHGLVARPSQPYSSNELRYELRMKPFLPLALPALVPYDDFSRENLLSSESDSAVIDRAYRAAGEARRSWENVLKGGESQHVSTAASGQSARKFDSYSEWMAEIKNNIRSSIAANIAITAVRSRLGRAQSKANSGDILAGLKVKIPGPGEKGSYSFFWRVPTIEL